MPLRFLGLVALATIVPTAASAQPAASGTEAVTATPRGTYLVYAEEDGSAFVSVEPSLTETGRWPMTLFYYRVGVLAGSARAIATADCAAGRAEARMTDVFGPEGAAVALPPAQAPIAFDRASDSAGDIAIVTFLCGDANARLAQSSAPIFGTPAEVTRVYIALRGLGISDRLARDIAIRDPDTNDALIDTAVPEAVRDQVRAIAGSGN